MKNDNNRLTVEQSRLVEDYFLLGMKIGNEYYNKNRDMIANKKLERDDIDQIVCVELCRMAKYYNAEMNFATLVKTYLPSNIGRVVLEYNIVKIPRIDNWELEMHKDHKIEFSAILHNGVFELDKPLDFSDGSGDEFSGLDMLPSSHSDSLDRMELEDELTSHFGSIVSKSLIWQSEGYSIAEISKYLGIKSTTLTHWTTQAKTKIKNNKKLISVQ